MAEPYLQLREGLDLSSEEHRELLAVGFGGFGFPGKRPWLVRKPPS